MDEITFFQHEGVRVTNTRFVVDGQTFAMNNITSVKPLEQKPSRLLPVLMAVVGLAIASQGHTGWLLLSLAGATWFALQKTMFHIVLHTSGGETSALKTQQKDYLNQVVTALNNAIVHRG
jgi:Family of unknown function (DUF6232)